MPFIGIIRGFGEGYYATGYIIKIIKALNRRFRSKLKFEEIALGNYLLFGCEMQDEEIVKLRECDAVFSGDLNGDNPIDYSIADIAMALDNCIEYTCISGLSDYGNVNVNIASYFDGGTKLRYNTYNIDGCSETRVCSTHTAMNIVKHVSRECERRRRRLAFVYDSDNEYCANLFYKKFEDFTLPLPNFHMIKFSLTDITYEILFEPGQFDTIFASKSFSDYAWGMYRFILNEKFTAYTKYAKSKSLYYVKGLYSNSSLADEVPSMCSYIVAFSEMLKNEFGMNKEAEHLRLALDNVLKTGKSVSETGNFVAAIIEELDKPVERRHSKFNKGKRYIIK